MDAPERILRIAERRQERADRVKAGTDPGGAKRLEAFAKSVFSQCHSRATSTAPSAENPYPARISHKRRSVRSTRSGRPTSLRL